MSDSVRPHRWQPTRLPRPWGSPGKNTGVGCHFLLQCMKVKSESEVGQSCLTLRDPKDWAPPSMGFSRQEYWSGVLSPSPIVTPVLVINISLSLLLLLLIVLICTCWKQKVKEFLSCSLRYLPGISEDTFTDATTKISVCHLQCLLQILLSAAKPSLAGYCFDMICYEICLQSSLLVSS